MAAFDFIKRSIHAELPAGEVAVRTLLAVIVPTALRYVIDQGNVGGPFTLYFPSILLIAVLMGWQAGTVAAVCSGIVGMLLFMTPAGSSVIWWQHANILTMYGLSAAAMVVIGHLLREAVLELQRVAEQAELFNHELQHRTRNAIQIMKALASRAKLADDPVEFYDKLGGRLTALAKANELLRFGALPSCEAADLVRATLKPFGDDQFTVSGDGNCQVARNACTPLVMALHELCTNAAKYGALSCPGGRVAIRWALLPDKRQVVLDWEESGGPPVVPPTRKGLGSRLLAPQGQMREVSLDYRPTGLACRIVVEAG